MSLLGNLTSGLTGLPGFGSQIPQKQIAINIALANNSQTGQPNTFAGTGSNQLNIQGLRSSVRIRNAGSVNSEASVRIWGLPPSQMNQLSMLGLVWNVLSANIVTIKAGDSTVGMATVFQGTIIHSYGDYENQPEAPFIMEASFSGVNNVTNIKESNYPKSFAVTDALKAVAGKMGLGFNGHDVSVQLPSMYVSGSPLQQARKLARAANIDIGSYDSIMHALTKTGNNEAPPVIISPSNGMISYPAFTPQGLVVKTLFNPQINFKSLIQVNSSVLSAIAALKTSGGSQFPTQWTVNKMDLDLDAQVPGGQWMTTCYGYNPKFAPGIIAPGQV